MCNNNSVWFISTSLVDGIIWSTVSVQLPAVLRDLNIISILHLFLFCLSSFCNSKGFFFFFATAYSSSVVIKVTFASFVKLVSLSGELISFMKCVFFWGLIFVRETNPLLSHQCINFCFSLKQILLLLGSFLLREITLCLVRHPYMLWVIVDVSEDAITSALEKHISHKGLNCQKQTVQISHQRGEMPVSYLCIFSSLR